MIVDACADCQRRTDLIAALAGRIEVEWVRRNRSRLLALSDEALLDWADDAGIRRRYDGFRAARAAARVEAAHLSAVCRCSERYPAALRDLPDPPAVLHHLGDPDVCLRAGEADGVSIVGARKASSYGLDVAASLARGLAAAGAVVVSGMALGIDSAAHAGALACGGTTVAVMAGAAERPYPASKRHLHRRIAATGCVVSEMPPGFGPFRWCFPARNRLIAALSLGTVVVEAAERSGSLITADFASEFGRPVAAVPGLVTSRLAAGTNALLKSGGELVRDAQDVLDLVYGVEARRAPTPDPAAGLSAPLQKVLARVEAGAGTPSALASTPAEAQAMVRALGELELRGLIRRTFGGTYIRASG